VSSSAEALLPDLALGRLTAIAASGLVSYAPRATLAAGRGAAPRWDHTVTHEHNGKLKVALGPETEVFAAPHGKDVDAQLLIDLRRMLKQAGFAPEGSPAIADHSTRDHGDGQWGQPT
jgi:hypothetical protein